MGPGRYEWVDVLVYRPTCPRRAVHKLHSIFVGIEKVLEKETEKRKEAFNI
jgi:hypothetical protein